MPKVGQLTNLKRAFSKNYDSEENPLFSFLNPFNSEKPELHTILLAPESMGKIDQYFKYLDLDIQKPLVLRVENIDHPRDGRLPLMLEDTAQDPAPLQVAQEADAKAKSDALTEVSKSFVKKLLEKVDQLLGKVEEKEKLMAIKKEEEEKRLKKGESVKNEIIHKTYNLLNKKSDSIRSPWSRNSRVKKDLFLEIYEENIKINAIGHQLSEYIAMYPQKFYEMMRFYLILDESSPFFNIKDTPAKVAYLQSITAIALNYALKNDGPKGLDKNQVQEIYDLALVKQKICDANPNDAEKSRKVSISQPNFKIFNARNGTFLSGIANEYNNLYDPNGVRQDEQAILNLASANPAAKYDAKLKEIIDKLETLLQNNSENKVQT